MPALTGRTALAGGVINEVFARPSIVARPTGAVAAAGSGPAGITPEYRALLRQRRIDAAKPKSSVVMLNPNNTAENNMLAAGVTGHAKGKREAFIVSHRSWLDECAVADLSNLRPRSRSRPSRRRSSRACPRTSCSTCS
jgi:hypothetical protein